MSLEKTITLETLAESFGTTVDDLNEDTVKLFKKMNTNYRIIDNKERDSLILDILQKIEKDQQIIGAPSRTSKWLNGWNENLNHFRNTDYDIKSLIPKFIRGQQPVRFMGNYIYPEEELFEHVYFNIFRTWLFKKYFQDYDSIYDVGCGCSYNLTKLCTMFPEKNIYGFDFVQSSVDIVNELAKNHNFKAKGGLMDIINPSFDLDLDENSLFFTSGVIEQIASKFENLLKFLLEKKPKLVVHIEPTYEVYNREILFDYLAAKFHKKRGYTIGYLPRLQQLEKEGKLEIKKVKRLNFGSLMMEGYTCIIWRPL